MRQYVVLAVVCCLAGGVAASQEVKSADNAILEGLWELARQSTVWSVNYSNMLLYAVVGAVVLAVGGAGVGFIGRSFDYSSWVDEKDALFLLSLMVGEGVEKYDCLNRLSCLDDQRASKLLVHSKMLIKGAKYLQPILGFSMEKYERIADGVHDAILHRESGRSCDALYYCPAMPSL